MNFNQNDQYSLGVEIEFQILDKNTLNLAPLAPKLLENSPEILSPRITHEFIRSILELQTGICFNVRDVENDLMETCSMAEELAEEFGCLLFATSLHPFAKYSDQVVSKDERYERIMNELQILGRKFISQGLHIHVGVSDGDTAMRVCNLIQLYLPLLLSLSNSSPFSNGQDTGLLSYRTKLFEVLPLAGLYTYFERWEDFVKEVDYLTNCGVIKSIRDLWWDARPNPNYGTIEIRICDLPGRFSDILTIVSIIQALVAHIAESEIAHKPYNQQLIRSNKWQAVRYGLEGSFIDPSSYLASERIPFRQAIALLVERIADHARDLGGEQYMKKVKRIMNCGPSAVYQKEIYAETGSFRKVILQSHQEFWQ